MRDEDLQPFERFRDTLCPICPQWYPDDPPGELLVDAEGLTVCNSCGSVISDYGREYYTGREYTHATGYENWWCGTGQEYLDNEPRKGRYKEKFHHNERISQWCMRDPAIPADVLEEICRVAKTGKYGPPQRFTRSSVIIELRDLKRQKYRERWKTILNNIRPDVSFEEPDHQLMEWCKETFQYLVSAFSLIRKGMPKTKIGNGDEQERHNFISYNYIQRKLFEVHGVYKYHHEFPVLRSHKKLHALDDVCEILFKGLNLPFSRSTVIQRPKLKCRSL